MMDEHRFKALESAADKCDALAAGFRQECIKNRRRLFVLEKGRR